MGEVVGHQQHNTPGSPPGFGGVSGGIFGFPHLPPPVTPLQQLPAPPGVETSAPLYVAGLRPKEKGWTELLTYNTGCAYGSGLAGGGAVGAAIGYSKLPAGVNWKLKLNGVMNQSSKIGGRTANSFAVFALLFSTGRYAAQRIRGGTNDRFNDIYGVSIATAVTAATHNMRIPQIGAATLLVSGVAAGVTAYRNANAIPYEEVYDLRNIKPLQLPVKQHQH